MINGKNSSVQLKSQHYTANAIRRGKEAREFHVKTGHPCDAVLGPALDSGCYADVDLTYAI